MKLHQLTYTERKGLPNYSHEEMVAVATIEEGQDSLAQMHGLRTMVKSVLHGERVEMPKVEVEKKIAKETTKPTPAPEAPKAEEKKAEAPKTEEKKEEAPKTEAKKETKKETERKTKSTSKATSYDRTLDAHKDLLGAFLDTQVPGWNKPERIKKAAEASKKLNGTDFLDGEGEILKSFTDAFLAEIKE